MVSGSIGVTLFFTIVSPFLNCPWDETIARKIQLDAKCAGCSQLGELCFAVKEFRSGLPYSCFGIE